MLNEVKACPELVEGHLSVDGSAALTTRILRIALHRTVQGFAENDISEPRL